MTSLAPLADVEARLVLAAASGDAQQCAALLPQLSLLLQDDGSVASGAAVVESARWGHTALLQQLLAAYGAAASSVYAQAAYHAATNGHVAALHVLLAVSAGGAQCGAATTVMAPGPWDPARASPLHAAARWGHGGCVGALLAAGAYVDAKDALGRTALHRAADWGCERVAAQLVASGADPTALDAAGATPCGVAMRHGHRRCAIALRGAPAAGDEPAYSDTPGVPDPAHGGAYCAAHAAGHGAANAAAQNSAHDADEPAQGGGRFRRSDAPVPLGSSSSESALSDAPTEAASRRASYPADMHGKEDTRQLGAVERAEHVGGGQARQHGAVELAEHVGGGQAQQLGAVELAEHVRRAQSASLAGGTEGTLPQHGARQRRPAGYTWPPRAWGSHAADIPEGEAAASTQGHHFTHPTGAMVRQRNDRQWTRLRTIALLTARVLRQKHSNPKRGVAPLFSQKEEREADRSRFYTRGVAPLCSQEVEEADRSRLGGARSERALRPRGSNRGGGGSAQAGATTRREG